MNIDETEPMGVDAIVTGQWNSTGLQASLSPETGEIAKATDTYLLVHMDTDKAIPFHADKGCGSYE